MYGVNVAERPTRTDRTGRLTFYNLRTQLWWAMREALDPANDTGIALPPDRRLLVDLAAPTWKLQAGRIQVESRESPRKRGIERKTSMNTSCSTSSRSPR